MILPLPDHSHTPFVLGETALISIDEKLHEVIVTGVATKEDKDGDTLHTYKYKFFSSDMVVRMGESVTDSSKNDLFHYEESECPFVLNEKAILVVPIEDRDVPDEIKHVFITGVAIDESGMYTYNYMECAPTLAKDENDDEVMVNKTGVTTSEDGFLHHLPWTRFAPFHKQCHVPFKIGEEAWLFDRNCFKKVKITKLENSGPKAFWHRYRVVNVGNPEEIFTCRCDDYDLFHLYETLPKLVDEDDGTGEPKAKKARKTVKFAKDAKKI